MSKVPGQVAGKGCGVGGKIFLYSGLPALVAFLVTTSHPDFPETGVGVSG